MMVNVGRSKCSYGVVASKFFFTVLQFGSSLKSLQDEANKFLGDSGISIGGGGISVSGAKLGGFGLSKMAQGRSYMKGWTPHTSKTDTTYRSTIRDTGRGLAQTSNFVPPKSGEQPKTYDEVKAECLESGTLWEDPDFPPVASSIYFKKPPSAWPNIQWKRPHVRF